MVDYGKDNDKSYFKIYKFGVLIFVFFFYKFCFKGVKKMFDVKIQKLILREGYQVFY